MKRYLAGVLGLVAAYRARFFRDKTSMFFTFLFPLIFLFIFGTIFNNNTVSFRVVVLNNSKSQFAKQFSEEIGKNKTFKVEDTQDLAVAKQKMGRGELDSIVELPSSFGEVGATGVPSGAMNVYYQKGAEQSGKTVSAVMQQILDGINKQFGRPDPALTVSEVATSESGASNFDYTFSGLLGFSLMSMGVFGLANSMPSEKQRGSFRRLRAAPFRASQLVLANALHYLQITLMSVAIMMVVGVTVFHFNMRGDWLVFGVFSAIAATMVLGFGLLIGALTKNENQAAALSNAIAMPMMFLSGAFFPKFTFPEWLQAVSNFVPLTPVIDGFRQIMTEHASLVAVAPQLGLIALWSVAVYFVAMRFFSWGEEN